MQVLMGQQSPFFSIVIPTYNRPERLATCLQSIAEIDYPRDRFEVIVVDDGSQMPLDSVVTPVQDQLDVTLLKQDNAGPAAARNKGAEQAKGQFLALTDDDCMPAPDWLKNFTRRFTTTSNCLIGGRTINALPDNLYSTASQKLIDYLYEYYNAKPEETRFFASNNIALPTELFHKIGGFDTSYPRAAAEDREFCDRWRSKGYHMLYAPEIKIYHAHELTLRSFWRQHFNYGRGAFCFHQMRSKKNLGQKSREPLSFYLNLLRYPFSQKLNHQALLLSLLFIVSQVATTAGIVRERSSS